MTHPAESLKVELTFSDRIGIVFDLALEVTDKGFTILSMEVVQDAGFAIVSIEGNRTEAHHSDPAETVASFSGLSGAESVRIVRTLPRERREKHCQAIFDGVSGGIIATDKTGRVTTANPLACHILGYKAPLILGRNVHEIKPNSNILQRFKAQGKSLGRHGSLVTLRGQVEFYASVQPIHNSVGRFMGTAALMKDRKKSATSH